jgi:hypothetical protein
LNQKSAGRWLEENPVKISRKEQLWSCSCVLCVHPLQTFEEKLLQTVGRAMKGEAMATF